MSDTDFAPDTQARLDALFAPWNRADAPGLIVGIRHGEHGEYRRAFGMASLETGVANALSTRMRIGSTSKHMLAALALTLEDEGLIDLDRPIGDYLPQLSAPNAEPTIRQLLQHRGGTRCHIDLGFIAHGMAAPPEGSAWEVLMRQTGRNFPPGSATCYNNGGYHLVSLALARLAGTPLSALLARKLFGPLSMSATSLEPSDHVMIRGAASLHLARQDCRWERGLFPSREMLGEGGVVSTIGDMLAWAAHVRDGLGARLLDLPIEADGSQGNYGLGLIAQTYRGISTFRHAGTVIGGSCEMVCAPQEALDVVILANGAPGASPSLLADQVVDIVLAPLVHPAAVPPPADAFAGWLGDYGSHETGMVYGLEEKGGDLHLRAAKYPAAWPLAAESDGWLTTGATGVSTIRVRPEQDSIRLRFAGSEERLEKLSPAPFDPAIIGRYESAESGLTTVIEKSEHGFAVQFSDHWGISLFDLAPLGGPWLHIRSALDPTQFGASLWFPEGWSGHFLLNSARTRGLAFDRVGCG